MDDEAKRLKRYMEMRDIALRHCHANISRAKTALDYAKIDRKHGYSADHLESLQNVAYYRENALWWFARYKKKCQQIAELEN